MLNDMFQRQARRLESQLYQRAQDQRSIELAQRQAQLAMAQVRALEQHHMQHAARISQGSKSLQQLQAHMRAMTLEHVRALDTCEALRCDVETLRAALSQASPQALASLQLRCTECPSTDSLRAAASKLESTLVETEREALQHIGSTPSTPVAMSTDSNPLNALSAVADYVSTGSPTTSPTEGALTVKVPGCSPLTRLPEAAASI